VLSEFCHLTALAVGNRMVKADDTGAGGVAAWAWMSSDESKKTHARLA